MSTVKELFENEELMNNIVEDIEDIPEDSEVTYEVWALGYTCDEEMTDAEILVGEFDDPDAAIACAEKVSFKSLHEAGYEEPDEETIYFSIEVETVVEDPDDEDGGTMNLGTVYSRELWLDGEYGSEEETGLEDDEESDFEDPIVAVAKDDYELLEDGTLKLSAKSLKGFNKNDYIRVQFLGEPDVARLPYRIVSKVIYADGDYYHCELAI
jgi:hypothetical protein